MKVRIKGIFNTFRRIIISGNDKAITDIINAKAVPSETPFSISTETMGTIPAALEYNGMPMKTDNGTVFDITT